LKLDSLFPSKRCFQPFLLVGNRLRYDRFQRSVWDGANGGAKCARSQD
jgi:hypothetical protein